MASTEQEQSPRGEQAATISNLMVRLTHDYTGRGPTRARTYLNDGLITIVMQDTLTKGELSLRQAGRGDIVLKTRFAFQQAMREDLIAGIEKITGRKVIAFMSANHLEPDLAIENFVMERDVPTEAAA